MASYYNQSPVINSSINIDGHVIPVNNPYGVPMEDDVPPELKARMKSELGWWHRGYKLKEGAPRYTFISSTKPLRWWWYILDTDVEPRR